MKYLKHISCIFIFCFLSLQSIAQKDQRNGYPQTQHLAPIADFACQNLCFGDTTRFINESIRASTYTWTISTTFHPSVIYTTNDSEMSYYFSAPGTFSVSLEAFNGHDVSTSHIITIDTVLKADFDFAMCSNVFVNRSRCASSFQWDFGDGATSTAFLPVHQYADTGHYSVRLVASNGVKFDTVINKIAVYATHFPNPKFTYHFSHDTLFCHAIDYDPGMFYHWSWGDLTFSTGRDTFHVFKDSLPSHVVLLLEQDPCLYAYHQDTIAMPGHPIIDTHGNLNFSNSSLLVFPNPANINSNLDLFYKSPGTNAATLSLYNSLGQKIFENDYSFVAGVNEFKIPIDNFSEGVYFITLQGDNVKSKLKFLVAHN